MSEDNEKPPLDAALRNLAEQKRRTLTSHPTPQELAAYHAGELPPEAEARILDHLSICPECSDLLLDLSGFVDLKPPEGVPELTDEQVEQDWQALRAKMRKAEPERPPAPVVPIRPKPERRWLPIAASLLAVLGISFGLYKDRQVQKLTQPAWGYIVDPAMTTRGDGESFSAKEPGSVRLAPNEIGRDYPTYEAIVQNDKGETVIRLPLPKLEGEPVLTIPAGFLKPGRYMAVLYGVDGDERESLADASFEVTP